jgi:hypothetical protein
MAADQDRRASMTALDRDRGWWESNEGIDAKGVELKIPPLPGERYGAYKARLFQVIASAAAYRRARDRRARDRRARDGE